VKKDYIIFNKPYGVLSQFTSNGDHRTLSEFDLPPEVYAAGRLDKDSEGLLLLTNDGPFIKKFLDHHPRTYWAQVERIPTPEVIKKLSEGVKIKEGMTKPCRVNLIEDPKLPERNPPVRFRKTVPTAWLEIELTKGKNRQVRKMTAAIGFPTLRLIRVGIGKFFISDLDALKPGEWLRVKKEQIL